MATGREEGRPQPDSDSYVEVEDSAGRTSRVGTWHQREDGTWVVRTHARSGPRRPPTKIGHYLETGWWLTLHAPTGDEVGPDDPPDDVKREAIARLARGLSVIPDALLALVPQLRMPSAFTIVRRFDGRHGLSEERRYNFKAQIVDFESLAEARDVGLGLAAWAIAEIDKRDEPG